MSEVVTDERIAGLLRPFVRASAPVLRTLRESDPLLLRRGRESTEPAEPGRLGGVRRRLDSVRLPGSSAWDAMTVGQRCDWWVERVGRLLAAVAGLPRFGGVITSRLPLRNALGTVGQVLVLSAIAAEHGVTDRTVQVRMIARVLFDRDLSDALASGAGSAERDEARTADLTGDLERSNRGRTKSKAVVRTVWRMARALWEIDSELDKRPQGRFYHEAIGSVPVVGVVGGYLGERSGLRRVARHGERWIRRHGT
ncbi:hypothetical protein FHX42_000256 [Saccharopolyspora lacisalsi]|uniref:Uncharacterized protein n=1 Tax=Halosaccharopolyspora lacisalsi TaxID=1000566 RepID=A0A839DU49_9PSEU|nr:hypothetical protein [Halosaccharopolyspora lacisalsi]MBA8822927.1 hypothetical protein [Halosaccharopolyspora lacisalsi]